MGATTVTSINSTTASLNDITFPGIYICNVNQVSKSFLTNLGIEDKEDAKLIFQQFLEKGPTDLDEKTKARNNKTLETIFDSMTEIYNWTRAERFYSKSSQNCTDMILYVQWKSNPTFTRSFYPALKTSTDYGACCVLNPYLDFEYEETRSTVPDNWASDVNHRIPKVYITDT